MVTQNFSFHFVEFYIYTYICASDVKDLATANMLNLNGKTEFTFVISKSRHLHCPPTSNTIDNASVPFKQSVKNLGSTLECHPIINEYASIIERKCCIDLRRPTSICRFLTKTATVTLVSAFVLSRIDHCNLLLFGYAHDVTSSL